MQAAAHARRHTQALFPLPLFLSLSFLFLARVREIEMHFLLPATGQLGRTYILSINCCCCLDRSDHCEM
ncbi:uncharacterized protein LAJ45_05668 [Morchella importuna]|uniref:uncharacterized protein n=1 Tax=Morchella importuna TaxID=1174673 RepID=UPI001E8D0A4A|nr:uncharacterized protein LAJ45_05668 [Morchella importuna]KAH8150455.1 hypothetical protein LAJ45_05668 [Morchella importuna]